MLKNNREYVSTKQRIRKLEDALRIADKTDAWPFWREFVQSASVKMGLPAITIPILKLNPYL